MKKLMLIAAFAALASCSDDTKNRMKGEIAESDVPAPVTAAFSAKYPGATEVKWEKETEDARLLYETEFKLNDQKLEAFWDENGTFIREEKD